jgi:ribosome-associated translation inhibitor RaiA
MTEHRDGRWNPAGASVAANDTTEEAADHGNVREVEMNLDPRQPSIVVRGHVPDGMVAYARNQLLSTIAHTPVPVLAAQLRLDHHADPGRERPFHVEMTIELDGTPVRARCSAPTMNEAIDRTASRLHRRVEAVLERPQAAQLRHRDTTSWHHDDQPVVRPHYYPRPTGERALLRRKTYALRPESIEEALFDLETLDHDFFLFVHDDTGAEAVVYRVDDGYGLTQRVETPEAIKRVAIPIEIGAAPATTTLKGALSVLDETDAPFEFFVDAVNGRGMVAYRRYDGHYGLILPDGKE